MLEKILSQKAFLSFIFVALIVGGIFSYDSMGKLEDPEIPVKAAVIITQYPGASADEVDREVTEVLEGAIQRLENIDFLESRSTAGMSEITINIKSGVKTKDLPQLWDHMRRKINDVKGRLPAGARDPIINDDFGDVSGIFLAITNDGYEYHEFQDYVDGLKEELQLLDGVKRIEVFGKQMEVINVSFDNDYFASLGINPMLIFQSFNDQGVIVDPGSFLSGNERIRISIGNKFESVNEIRDFEVKLPNGGRYRLGQIATVEREFYEPSLQKLKYNGQEAISLALSMESGGNVIVLGEAIEKRLAELQNTVPVGIEIHKIFYQHNNVEESIDNFVINLIESIVIVIVVLLVFMGMRAGLLIASGLVFTILATFILMLGADIELHRVSLAAIIIAMGMLVDNAIVVADGILIDLEKGIEHQKAFTKTAKKSAMPLLAATLVAILAFMPLAFNSTGAGEFLRPLFWVLALSLFSSWVLAMIQTPFHAQYFYKKRKKKQFNDEQHNAYNGRFYQLFGKFIKFALWHKSLTVVATGVFLVLAFWSFRFVKQDFFPGATYDQFILEYRLPEGHDISIVEDNLDEIQKELNAWDEIDYVVTSLGSTPVRYTLMRPMNGLSLSYGELIISIKDKELKDEMVARVQDYVTQYYPQSFARVREYVAIGGAFKVEAKFSGPDEMVLRQLAEQANVIMRNEPKAAFVTQDWRNTVKVLTPVYSNENARELMVSRSDVANALAIASNGMPVGVYYNSDYQLPVMLKLDKDIGEEMMQLESIPVWSGLPQSVALGQLVDSIDVQWANSMIRRYDGQRAIKAQCDPIAGVAPPELLNEFKEEIDAIPLPDGYKLEWLGVYKSSKDANKGLSENMPLAFLLILIIIIGLFNNFRQPLIILSIMPLAFIGVIIGFLTTGFYFSFFSVIGTLGLMGMMIKNAVVLLDEINLQVSQGKDKLNAIIDSTLSRVRPVMMASLTTILGMLPLVFDDMFKTMATAIMFGLLFGSVITLIVIPVLYAVLYRVDTKKLHSHINETEEK